METRKAVQRRAKSQQASYWPTGEANESTPAQLLHMQKYLSALVGYNPNAGNPETQGVLDSFALMDQYRASIETSRSVIIEPSVVDKSELTVMIEHAIADSGRMLDSYSNLIERVARHTELCRSIREIRHNNELLNYKLLTRAIVDIHDCVRFTQPEDMTREMISAVRDALSLLMGDLDENGVQIINKNLISTGLRPWQR